MKTFITNRFEILSEWISANLGSPYAFMIACAVVALWAVSGPIFGFSDTWQLIINTGTTIITFLMIFVLQNTQNRDSEALQAKLDGATKGGLQGDVKLAQPFHHPRVLLGNDAHAFNNEGDEERGQHQQFAAGRAV